MIVSTTTVTVFSYRVLRIELTAQVGKDLQKQATKLAQQVSNLLINQVDQVTLISLSNVFQNELNLINSRYPKNQNTIQQEIQKNSQIWHQSKKSNRLLGNYLNNPISRELREYQKHFPNNYQIFVTDKYGAIAGTTNLNLEYNQGEKQWWQQTWNNGRGAVYIEEPQYNQENLLLLVNIAVPIYKRSNSQASEVIGIIHTSYKISHALLPLLQNINSGKTGHAYLFVSPKKYFSDYKFVNETNQELTKFISSLASYKEIKYQGEKRFFSKASVQPKNQEFSLLNNLPWLIIIYQDSSEILHPLIIARQTIMMAALGTLLVAGILASFIERLISTPIRVLTKITQRIASGDLDYEIDLEQKDEIGLLAANFNIMVESLKSYFSKLRTSLKELSDMKFALDQSVLVTVMEPNGRITYVNDKFCEISQYSRQELIGNNYRFLKSRYHTPEFYQSIWDTLNQGNIWRGEIKNQTKDGSYYWVDSTMVPFLDENNKPFQYLAIRYDITARKDFEEALSQKVKERTDQLAQANQEIIQLNHQLQGENLRMSAQLNVARQLQQMVLPKPEELAAIKGLELAGFMEPADEVGGDYYDVLATDDVVTISIGDVTGHGLESGILMIMTQTVVRTLKEIREHDPVKFLDTLNRTLYRNIERMNSDRHLTLAVLNYSHRRVSLSGQHEEVIFVRAGGELQRIDTMNLGFPIGLDQNITDFIDQISLELQTGDGLVLYTDGITEAKDINKNHYGIERLCQVIQQNWEKSAQQIQELVIQDLHEHIGQQKIFDDITLFVLKQK
ncbi:SpoIIE family protein phosphatase [Rippkaea orientalis]|nr:SpoIIE family protein phosphatase [Rippkaea orientalis]